MEKIIISRPHETVANLADLAVQIDVEHGHVEAAIYHGLAHARQAGILLLQAKARLPHGNWLAWLQANCKVTSRAAQRYMRVAENWAKVVAKGGTGLGLSGALRLIAHSQDNVDISNTTRVSYLPAPLAYYHHHGLIKDDSLQQLLDLEMDFGAEVPTPAAFKACSDEVTCENVFWLLNTIRPLDHPPLWPYPHIEFDKAGGAAVVAASRIFLKNGRARRQVPQWEVAAFWFGSTMVYLADNVEIAPQFASVLRDSLEVWREEFRTALAMALLTVGRDMTNVKDRDFVRMSWSYRSDLRHAGVSVEMLTDPDNYPALSAAAKAASEEVQRSGFFHMPSSMQGRLSDTPINDGADSDVDPEIGEAWEHPDDRLK